MMSQPVEGEAVGRLCIKHKVFERILRKAFNPIYLRNRKN